MKFEQNQLPRWGVGTGQRGNARFNKIRGSNSRRWTRLYWIYPIVGLSLSVFIFGCATPWETASKTNNYGGYHYYLEVDPAGVHVGEARKRMEEIAGAEWNKLVDGTNAVTAIEYLRYADRFFGQKHAEEALRHGLDLFAKYGKKVDCKDARPMFNAPVRIRMGNVSQDVIILTQIDVMIIQNALIGSSGEEPINTTLIYKNDCWTVFHAKLSK